MDAIESGQILEIQSSEISVEEELPAWCRMTRNELVSWTKNGQLRSYLVCKGRFDPHRGNTPTTDPHAIDPHAKSPRTMDAHAKDPNANGRNPSTKAENGGTTFAFQPVQISIPSSLPQPVPVLPIVPLSVMGIGSWPRPRWMVKALHEYLEGKITEEEFHATADDAVRLCVEAQLKAGVDVITDGEQRRDNYASFVGQRLDNCQLIPLVDLLPMVDNPDELEQQMNSLDVPASKIRHPVVLGPLGRSKPLVLHEFEFLKTLTDLPIKIALPGPYLLTRTMWLECITDKYYGSREALAADIVRVLREELHYLLAAGVHLVQFDEPVLSEVVFSAPHGGTTSSSRTFMCGALSEKGDPQQELAFASHLINQVTQDLPASRLGLHICRGNWTPDESAALAGSYDALLPALKSITGIGTYFLEFCTTRAGSLNILKDLAENVRVGLGVVNQKDPAIEAVESIVAKAEAAAAIIGKERLHLNPDCGFATFADNPVTSAEIARRKLAVIREGASRLGRRQIN